VRSLDGNWPRGPDGLLGSWLNKLGTYPLSKINLAAFQKRFEGELAAVRAAGETVEAFEIGNELDLYCNDADSPTGAEWAKHQWKWFLSDAQAQAFVRGYGPVLAASVASIRKYFPQAQVITYGNSMPASAPLMEALASVRGADGKITDYTRLVDGYGSHLYPTSTTTLNMVQDATNSLRYEAAHCEPEADLDHRVEPGRIELVERPAVVFSI
jgi:hypothetical protein